MIGLQRGIVRHRNHDRRWKILFERERTLILKRCGDRVVDVQHIGSTAIPRIPAKPVIDIAVGVRLLKDGAKLIGPLRRLGYALRRQRGGSKSELLFVKGPERRRTHYAHILRFEGTRWRNDLLFRDRLRSSRRRARQYGELKRKLASRYPDNRKAYTKNKTAFILRTIRRVRKPGATPSTS